MFFGDFIFVTINSYYCRFVLKLQLWKSPKNEKASIMEVLCGMIILGKANFDNKIFTCFSLFYTSLDTGLTAIQTKALFQTCARAWCFITNNKDKLQQTTSIAMDLFENQFAYKKASHMVSYLDLQSMCRENNDIKQIFIYYGTTDAPKLRFSFFCCVFFCFYFFLTFGSQIKAMYNIYF